MKRLPKTDLLLLLPIIVFLVFLPLSNTYIGELFFSFYPIYILATAVHTVIVLLNRNKKTKINRLSFWAILTFLGITTFQIINVTYKNSHQITTKEADLTIASMNIFFLNYNYNELIQAINNVDTDIIVLIEYKPHHSAMDSIISEKYPYSSAVIDQYNDSIKFVSKYPLNNKKEEVIYGTHIISSSVEVEKSDVIYKIFGVHTTAPTSPSFKYSRDDQIKSIEATLQRNKVENTIIVGDFNTSPWSPVYNNLEKELGNYYNATLSKGPIITWTFRQWWLPISTHIDHVFLSKNLNISKMEIKEIPKSDHKAVIVEVIN